MHPVIGYYAGAIVSVLTVQYTCWVYRKFIPNEMVNETFGHNEKILGLADMCCPLKLKILLIFLDVYCNFYFGKNFL